LLVALVGVIETESPVISINEVLVVLSVSVFVALTTCNTLPAGKPVVVALVSTVPVASGSVSVLFVFVTGANRVTVPVPVAPP
jgi:hypothetical protein